MLPGLSDSSRSYSRRDRSVIHKENLNFPLNFQSTICEVYIWPFISLVAENTDDLTYIDTAFKRNPLHPSWYWQHRAVALFAHSRYEEVINNIHRSSNETEVAHLYLAASYARLAQLDKAKEHVKQLYEMNPEANIDWLNITYPTRCYEESEHRSHFIEGLRIAGMKQSIQD